MKRFKLVLILLVFSAFIAGCDIGHTHNYIDGVCECGDTIVDKFKVTFIDYDGSILKQEMVEPNASAVAPENPVRVGYEFVGWNTSFDNVTGDLIIVAQYNYEYDQYHILL